MRSIFILFVPIFVFNSFSFDDPLTGISDNAEGSYTNASQNVIVLPFGARQLSMGITGVALADEEETQPFNPAGLGLANNRYIGGSLSYINNYFNCTYQFLNANNLGISCALLNNTFQGRSDKWTVHYLDILISSGYSFYKNKYFNHSIGIGFEYSETKSSLRYRSSSGCNLGYVVKFMNRVNLGICLKNIQANINKTDTSFHEAMVPIELLEGIGYNDHFDYNNYDFLRLSFEFSARTNMWHSSTTSGICIGGELKIFNSLSIRSGYNSPFPGREIFGIGNGISLFNHFDIDISKDFFFSRTLSSLIENGRIGQASEISISFYTLLKWNKNDLTWWKQN
jgi:hypothetical protein